MVEIGVPDETANTVDIPDITAQYRALVVPEIVALPEEIDITNAASCGDGLRAAIRPGVAVVIADMTRTAFCDSQGMRQLVLAHDRAMEAGAELRLAIESPAVLRALKITGLDQLLQIYPGMQAALQKG
jgi:anti-sigma B factor antagonist